MAIDNEILAGRLTIDIKSFTDNINKAVTEANNKIARIGKNDKGADAEIKAIEAQKKGSIRLY